MANASAERWESNNGKSFTATPVEVDVKSVVFENTKGQRKSFAISSLANASIKRLCLKTLDIPKISANRSWPSAVKPSKIQRFDGKLESYSGSTVTLKKFGGAEITVPFRSLSAGDQNYVKTAYRGGKRGMRVWKISEKSPPPVAKFMLTDGRKVYLKSRDGKTISVPIASLSKEEIHHVNAILASAAARVPKPRIPTTRTAKVTRSQAESRQDQPRLADGDTGAVPPVSAKKAGSDDDATPVPAPKKVNDDVVDVPVPAPPLAPTPRRTSSRRGFAAPAMTAVGLVILLLVNSLVAALCLWISKMITHCETSFLILLVTSFVSGLVSLVPIAGIFIAGPIQLVMIMWLSRTNFIDTLFMIVVANLIFMVASFLLVARMMRAMGY